MPVVKVIDFGVAKALGQQLTDKTDTATALADDVQRFLAQEPILARPASSAYRLKKFVLRNKLAVSAGATIAATIFVGLSLSIWSATSARQAYQIAEQERRQAEVQRVIAERERDNATQQRNQVSTLNDTLNEQQEKQRRMLYTSDMNLVQVAAEAHEAARMRSLLEKHRPLPGHTDLCGFEWHYWHRKLHSEIASIKLKDWQQTGYGGLRFIDSVSRVIHLSPLDQRAVMWDVATGNSIKCSFPTLRSSIEGGRSYVVAGTRFAIGEASSFKDRNSVGPRVLTVYELDRDDPLMSVSFSGKGIMSPQLSRDGRFVAATETITDNQTSAAEHRALKIWEVSSGREVFALPIPDHSAKVTFHPSEPKIVVTLTDLGPEPKAHAMVIDLNDASELAQIPVNAVQSVFNRDGSLFAVVVSNRNRSDVQLQMYDANDNYAHLWTIPLITASITPGFSEDSHWVAVTSGSGIRVFGARDVREGASLLGHTASILSLGICERTGNLLSIDANGIVKRWQLDSNLGRNTVKFILGDSLEAISIDGARFATAKIEPPNSGTVLDKSGRLLWKSSSLEGKLQSLSCGLDGRRVAALVTMPDGDPQSIATIFVWDVDSRRELLRRQFAGKQDSRYKPIVSIDPTGDLIAVSHALVTHSGWTSSTSGTSSLVVKSLSMFTKLFSKHR